MGVDVFFVVVLFDVFFVIVAAVVFAVGGCGCTEDLLISWVWLMMLRLFDGYGCCWFWLWLWSCPMVVDVG